MRILHTSDWHLGKTLGPFSRQEEQEAVLEEICLLAEQESVDAVLVAGDVFDTANPSIEAETLFYRTVKRLSREGHCAVTVIAGNHDSPQRLPGASPLARECGIVLLGLPGDHCPPFALPSGLALRRSEPGLLEWKLPRHDRPLHLLVLPYANEVRLKRALVGEKTDSSLRDLIGDTWAGLAARIPPSSGPTILLAHAFMMRKDGECYEEGEDEKPIRIGGAEALWTTLVPPCVDYVALGHLHRWIEVASDPCPIVYCGSPLATAPEDGVARKSVALVEFAPSLPPMVRALPLHTGRQVRRLRFDSVDQAVEALPAYAEDWVECTLVCERYLSTEDQARIRAVHPRLLALIPAPRDITPDLPHHPVDPGLDISELFVRFFRERKGLDPSDEILTVFRELLAGEDPA